MDRPRVRRRAAPAVNEGAGDGHEFELGPADLGSLLAPPRWLRDLGVSAWLLAGVAVVTVAGVWLASLTRTIVMPVITASVVAAVASPVIRWLQRRGVPRGLGAALLLVALLALGAAIIVLVLVGVASEEPQLSASLASAKDTLEGWLRDAGVSSSDAAKAKEDASSSVSTALPALLNGVMGGIGVLSGLVFFLSLAALSVFFLMKDGPAIRTWIEGHAGVPLPVAHTISGRVLQSLRGYFVGVTVVAAFNGIVVGIGALILGVPLPATIALVTFLAAYIPYLGAWTAGAFAVLLALGGAGTDAALGMIVLQLLANGVLQQMIQPIAYGAALGIHPLAVLIVTIGGGCLFGAAGLVLAAPLTSAATRIAGDLEGARATGEPAEAAQPA